MCILFEQKWGIFILALHKMSREDFWNEIRKEAEVEAAKEPMLSSFYFTSILSHDCLEKSLSFALANRLCTKTLLSTQLIEIFNEVLLSKDSEQLRNNIRRDLVAVLSRDPACNSYVQALLLFKGFQKSFRLRRRQKSNRSKM